jgi:leucyl/phenylalanyl-tRNA--protein transferase
LLAAGGNLEVETLLVAYGQGVFPWFSRGQPVLWWSPDPRMVLPVKAFKLRRSFRKKLLQVQNETLFEIRTDTAFEQVVQACAQSPRDGQTGTWIVPAMVRAYTALHHAGYAHSVETWKGGKLVGGLYCTVLGKAVFGESMFTRVNDASKIALAALVAFCASHGIEYIDCQQNTPHLAFMGAHEMPRSDFLKHVQANSPLAGPEWAFDTSILNIIL